MKYHLWPVLSGVIERCRALGARLRARSPRRGRDTEVADLDQWVHIAADDESAVLAAAGSRPSAELLEQVGHALADDDASLVPPLAARELSQAEWDALPGHLRARYQRQQVRQKNPLLFPLTIKQGIDRRRLRR